MTTDKITSPCFPTEDGARVWLRNQGFVFKSHIWLKGDRYASLEKFADGSWVANSWTIKAAVTRRIP